MQHASDIEWLGSAILIVAVAGPLVLALMGMLRSRGQRDSEDRATTPWLGLTVNSAVLYALAFNLTFFLQELFLVVPKALTPGLQPTLYHNNHTWAGDNPLENLFQGTGALAILAMGFGVLLWLRRARVPGRLVELFAAWLVYHGFMQSLPQIPSALLDPRTDVGRAFNYLQLDDVTTAALSLVALAGIAFIPQWLTPVLLSQARDEREVGTPWQRTVFAFRVATLPGLIGTLLVIPFRLPGDIAAVVVAPTIIAALGISWIQAGAWGARPTLRERPEPRTRVALAPLAALVAVFLFFHLVLARGVAFY